MVVYKYTHGSPQLIQTGFSRFFFALIPAPVPSSKVLEISRLMGLKDGEIVLLFPICLSDAAVWPLIWLKDLMLRDYEVL